MDEPPQSDSNDELDGPSRSLVDDRKAKRDVLRAQGIDPYPPRFDVTATSAELRSRFGELPPDSHTGEVAQLAGRVSSVRGHGRLSFVTLDDATGQIQLLVQSNDLAPETAAVFALVDLGDWIGCRGEVVTSRRGELSIAIAEMAMLSKALRPLPDKWRGLNDSDTRYRQREVDLIANAQTRRTFEIRFRTLAALRELLTAERFLEVETPILQPQAGGALARPFVTRSNALDMDFSLRIAPELYLKRLIIGGLDRVFEIARNFRNEGIDTRHSPEFTSLEAYRAFGDADDGMDLTERLIAGTAKAAIGGLTVTAGESTIDLSPPWPRYEMLDLLEATVGRRLHPGDEVKVVQAVCDERGVPYLPTWGSGKLIFELYDALLLPEITGPAFLSGFPVEVSPLARHRQDDPLMADRFELVIDRREFANGYSELNIPEEQEERFRSEVAAAASGDLDAHPADLAYVRALEFGLPPTSGIGIGVDRLVMLLAQVSAIRDVILFPMLRPEATE